MPTEWILVALVCLLPIIWLLWRSVDRESRRPAARERHFPTPAELQEDNRLLDVPLGVTRSGPHGLLPPSDAADRSPD